MRIALAQVNPTVGDLDGNVGKMLAMARRAADEGADAVAFPAGALTGLPLAGLAASATFVEDAQAHLLKFGQDCPLVAFVPCMGRFASDEDAEGGEVVAEGLYVVGDGSAELLCVPDLDEQRTCAVVEVAGTRVAVLLDGRFFGDVTLEGMGLLLELAADEYTYREAALPAWGEGLARPTSAASWWKAPLAHLSLVGGADAEVFAGGSYVLSATGELVHVSPVDAEDLFVFDTAASLAAIPEEEAELAPEEIWWRGIVMATRDYFAKNGFSDALIGLSGGIDSAVTATVAVDALGASHVHGILMPSPYSSEGSLADAAELAENLGIGTVTIPITGPMESFHEVLADACGGAVEGLAAENLQARIRAVYLLTVSNARGWLLLNTGNKSEAAMGFSTLYGDTAGAYAPIGGLYKTDVYRLARWRAAQGPSIPQESIDKAPSAELYPGAKDQDRLPPYEKLDAVLFDHVEGGLGAAELVAQGHDAALVRDVLRGVQRAEFKRRLEPMGPIVNGRSLTDAHAWPITNGWVDRGADDES